MTRSTTDADPPIVVVGGGPTGITAAILLAQHGLPVVVLERHLDVYPHPRAVHLDDEVHRILQQVGVGADFTRISRPGSGLRVLDRDHGVLAEFHRPTTGPHGYPRANMFDQPDLERLLGRHLAAEHPEVVVRRGVEVVAIDVVGRRASVGGAELDSTGTAAQATSAVVSFRDAEVANGAVERIHAAAVLGCDGANSVTRAVVGGRWRDLRFEERWLVLDGECDQPLGDGDAVDQIADPGRAATFMRIGADRYRWEFRIHDGEDEEQLCSPARRDALLEPWVAGIPQGELRLRRCSAYTFQARVADRWRRDRVFLLGDAAHLTPPFVGQGLGAGLRDAANLTWKLARVLAGDAPETLLDSYEVERRRHAVQQIRQARTVGWALTGGNGRVGAAARRSVLRAVFLTPGLAPRLLDRGSPALRGSSLTADRRRRGPRSLVGSLVPQPNVTDGDVTRPLDEVLGLRTAILARTRPDADLLALAVRIGARVLALDGCPERGVSPSAGVRTIDADGTLVRWLERVGATAVVIRPDRVVLAVARSTTRPGRELAASAACRELVVARPANTGSEA